MRKRIFLILLAIVALSLPSMVSAAEKPIVLGLPTSFFQPLCKSGKLAVEMAIDEINAQGGIFVKDEGVKRPLKLVTADTRCGEPGTPVQAALMAVDKLITEEKPDAIVVAP